MSAEFSCIHACHAQRLFLFFSTLKPLDKAKTQTLISAFNVAMIGGLLFDIVLI